MKKNPFAESEMLTFSDSKASLSRSVFSLGKVKKAELKITALGYFEAFFNGVLLSENRLMPPKSDYCRRDLTNALYPIHDKTHSRIYYYTFDVTSLMSDGKNVLAAHIGAGWYGQDECNIEGMGKWGDNCLMFSLAVTFPDGTKKKISPNDTKNTCRGSFVTRTNIYYGEKTDAMLFPHGWTDVDFDDGKWNKSKTASVPDSEFTLADCPPDRVTRTVVPILIHEKDGTKIYDLGETVSGTPIVSFYPDAKDGDCASLYFADVINEDCTPNFHYTGGENRLQHDEFVYSSSFTEQYRLHFTWNAGRYIILSGNARIKSFEEIRTDIKQRVFFKCGNEILQWFFDAYVRTQETNIHGSIPSDCPHRERLGYTGDGQLCSAAGMYIFDSREMYRKWMRDIRDCQDAESGHIQHTAPFYGGGGGPGGWGGAAVIVPWNFYRFFGDKKELKTAFPSMIKYLRYMRSHSDNFLVTREEKDGWCLGDWCPPHNKVLIPESFVNTFFFAECAKLALKSADILGETKHNDELTEMFEGAKKALHDNFFDTKTGSFCDGVQGADAFAVHLGAGDERTAENLIAKYSKLREFDTGIFGTYYLIGSLFSLGKADLAVALLTNRTENSFYNMMKHGSANLWENWDGCDSLCHPMFGASAEFVVSKILGIGENFFDASEETKTASPVSLPATGDIDALICTDAGDFRLQITYSSDGKQTVKINMEESR